MTPAAKTTSAPNLASCYQEILTVTARLRTRKFQVGDSAVFRTQVRKALSLAESTATQLGHEQDDVRLASYAVIALLDETIFNSGNQVFRDWAAKPLMLDLYGTVNAGEGFYEYLNALLQRRESKQTIDLMEVFLLCLMLGFRGRYNTGSGEQVHRWTDPLVEKIQRHRGTNDYVQLARNWLPEAAIDLPLPSNRLTRLVVSGAIGCVVACVLLFVVYYFLLGRGVSDLASFIRR